MWVDLEVWSEDLPSGFYIDIDDMRLERLEFGQAVLRIRVPKQRKGWTVRKHVTGTVKSEWMLY